LVKIAQTKLSGELIAGRYRYVRELAASSSGGVWLVEDQAADSRLCALKWLDPGSAQRVQSELSLLRRIAHPGLARAYDLIRVGAGELGSRRPQAGLGMVSEYVSGEPIDRAASLLLGRREPLIELALRVLDGATQALAALHAHGFVHGDVKPDHLLIDKDAPQLVLLDLGLARAPGFSAGLSGSPHFMAPELFRGELTQAADVYALGLCLRGLFEPELARQAGSSASPAEFLARALAPRPALPSWVPPPLAALIERMCAVDRSARPASALELSAALTALARALPEREARALRNADAGKPSAQARASALCALPLVGQERALAELVRGFEMRRGLAVLGPPGAGRSRLVREAVFALQLSAANAERPVPSYREVQRLPEQLGAEPGVWHVLDGDAVDVPQLQRLLHAAELAGTSAWVVLERSRDLPPDALDWLQLVRVGALERKALVQLLAAGLGKAPSEPWLREAQAVSGGLAGRLCRALSAALLSGNELSDAGVLRRWQAGRSDEASLLPAASRELALVLALAGGSLPGACLAPPLTEASVADGARALCTLGLGTYTSSGQLLLRNDVGAQLRASLPATERAALAARIPEPPALEAPRARAFLAWARGDTTESLRHFSELAEQALTGGDPAAAETVLAEAEELLGPLPAAPRMLRADALRALARYPEALAQLSAADASPAASGAALGAEERGGGSRVATAGGTPRDDATPAAGGAVRAGGDARAGFASSDPQLMASGAGPATGQAALRAEERGGASHVDAINGRRSDDATPPAAGAARAGGDARAGSALSGPQLMASGSDSEVSGAAGPRAEERGDTSRVVAADVTRGDDGTPGATGGDARAGSASSEPQLSASGSAEGGAAVRAGAALGEPGGLELGRFEARALPLMAAKLELVMGAELALVPEAWLLRAEILRLHGAPAEAWGLAELVLGAEPPAARKVQAGAQALLARLCLDRGDTSASRAYALQAASEAPQERAGLRAAEVLALVELAEGRLDAALSRAEPAAQLARRRGERAAEARLCAVLGSVERARGELPAAARQFARAAELAEAQGERHAALSFSANQASAQLDAGELGPALAALRASASGFVRLGRERDAARVLTNWMLGAQLIGDHTSVLALGERLREAAARADDPWALSFGLLSCAETTLDRGDAAAARAYLQALPALDRLGPPDRAVAHARSAAVWAELGQLPEAELQLTAAEALAPEATAVAAELQLARAALARARSDHAAAFAAAERAHAEAQARTEFPVLVAALTASASAASALGNTGYAHLRYSELRALLDAAALTLSAAERALLRNVRGYRAALAAAPPTDRPLPLSDARLRGLTAHVKRLTAETRLPRLYERILEAAIALSGAERGLLLRRDPQGRVRVRAQLGAAEDAAATPYSQSIVSRVLMAGQALASVNAAQDARLSGSSSVHALALCSVLALPLRTPDAVSGVIYLEDRLRPFAFGEAEVSLSSDFADLASLAITSVERLRRERRAVRRLSLAQARLAVQLEAQALELSALKQAQAPDFAHTGIVAQSQVMRDVLSLALRVAAADVPVLIRGESGTGKELVARAIHAESARSKRPFISESCGAIPESLLESALFGHVKGAFTGADRRRVGLFEAADGGTLFLDEIAEMSPSMQTRLLRVLQEGEVRPLGGERTVRVDVRVLAATHRDLEAMVADGRFREDLFYRLAVVSLQLPALRERNEDILALVQHFVQKHAPGRSPLVSRRALARLMTQPWPGNVRQLENEVRRALILGGDVLREEHFGIAPAKESGGKVSELNLRGQVDELERKLIRRALDLAKGNQTRAAELLGVSRFGLQKMVKRLGIGG